GFVEWSLLRLLGGDEQLGGKEDSRGAGVDVEGGTSGAARGQRERRPKPRGSRPLLPSAIRCRYRPIKNWTDRHADVGSTLVGAASAPCVLGALVRPELRE